MQRKRYSWHLCVHYHGYLVHLQQNGLVHDLTLQLQEHIPPLSTAFPQLFSWKIWMQQWGTQHKFSQRLQHIFRLYSLSLSMSFGKACPWFSSNFSSKPSSIAYLQILPAAFYLFKDTELHFIIEPQKHAYKNTCDYKTTWVCQGRAKVWGTRMMTMKS